ncbi:MAG: poly(R)-hydroxyalkanoic acid synthase subunit PhaE [Gammaproteobacteria bacterium]|nr:poly(R)-hydroxyalkanoic acid synthase subunit PhaE [Gammaproteobacteria bacterium]
MASKARGSGPQEKPPGAPEAPHAAAAAMTEAAQAWTTLLDGWWRQQARALPPELERPMGAMLDQSKALVNMAFGQARAAADASVKPASARREGSQDPKAGELGLWQPVIDACRACETSLLGEVGGSDSGPSAAAREYQRAASAYLNEFVQINGDVARRLQKKLASKPPADFRRLHALVVEEVENAYLDRVSTDAFAAVQAAFINAMFRLRQQTARPGAAGTP